MCHICLSQHCFLLSLYSYSYCGQSEFKHNQSQLFLFHKSEFAIISYSITLTANKLIWKITCLEIFLFCFANAFILGKTAVSGALAFSKEQEEIFQQVKNNPIQNQVFHGWTLTFKNRLGAAGIDTSKIVYLADDDSLSKPIPHSLGGRHKSILK